MKTALFTGSLPVGSKNRFKKLARAVNPGQFSLCNEII